MFKHIFERIDGIGIYPLISMLVFVAFFTGVAWWALTANKEYIKKMGDMPLEEDHEDDQFTL